MFVSTVAAGNRPAEGNAAAERIARARTQHRAVALWLFSCAAMIFLMVVVGGITRLTLSGLSITEWRPLSGILPPLTHRAWVAAFDGYKKTPEFRYVHYWMTLGDFKGIFFWEYAHRLLGRLIGVVFAVPFVYFLVRGWLPRHLRPALFGIFVLGGCQGLLGWYMVESGLVHRVEVSQYRLVAHLSLALVIYAAILWVGLGLWRGAAQADAGRPWRRASEAVAALVFVTIIAGGFTAGLDAGLTYNTFPLMDGHWIPAGYARLHPFVRNWFANVAAVQFDHRVLAMTTAAAVLALWGAAWRAKLPRPARLAIHLLLAAVALQVGLGISTLLLVVPVPLAACHQAGAVVLLSVAILVRHTLRRRPNVSAPETVAVR